MKSTWFRFLPPALALLALTTASASALAAVKYEGDWDDDDDTTVSLDLDHVKRGEAIKRLADAAGWSVVFENPPTDVVDVHLKNAPAVKVLEVLLANGDFVARRDDKLVDIRRDSGASAPSPPAGPTKASDRMVTGSSLTVAANETVNDVAVLGGSLDVYGTVQGDAMVTGGSVHVHSGAKILGDCQAMGGSVNIDDGATVNGDVEALGGSVHRAAGAHVGGDLHSNANGGGSAHSHHRHRHERIDIDSKETLKEAKNAAKEVLASPPKSFAEKVRGAITLHALLFVFGAVMLALLESRMEKLRVQIASHPMRTFAFGVIGLLGIAVALVALCVTVVGIPFAVAGVVLLFFGVLAGIVSVLETVGAALLGHRTKNPYLHLACGCFLLMIIGSIPFVGGFVELFVFFIGLGALVKTGGVFGRRKLGRGTDMDDASFA